MPRDNTEKKKGNYADKKNIWTNARELAANKKEWSTLVHELENWYLVYYYNEHWKFYPTPFLV